MLDKIELCPVTELGGAMKYLELRQGANFIRLSLELGGGGHRNGYRWEELKEAIDALVAHNKKKAMEDLGGLYPAAPIDIKEGHDSL